MMTKILLELTIAFLGAQGAGSPDRALEDAVLLRKVLELRLEAISIGPDTSWVLGQIASTRIFITVPGATYDVDTGKETRPPGAVNVRLVEGKVEVVQALSDSAKKTVLDFKWEIPFGGLRKAQGDAWTPFQSKGSLLICQVHEAREGKSRFDPVFHVPADWGASTAPALVYSREHASLFKRDEAKTNREALVKLLEDPNPFLAVAAARTLAEAGMLDGMTLRGPIATSADLRQAAVTWLGIAAGASGEEGAISILETIEANKESRKLNGIALAVSAIAAGSPDVASRVRGRMLLNKLIAKFPPSGTTAESNPYLQSILARARLREAAAQDDKK